MKKLAEIVGVPVVMAFYLAAPVFYIISLYHAFNVGLMEGALTVILVPFAQLYWLITGDLGAFYTWGMGIYIVSIAVLMFIMATADRR